MLHWPKGKQSSDGVWSEHWYKNVEESTTFHRFKEVNYELPNNLVPIYKKCVQHYNEMYEKRIII